MEQTLQQAEHWSELLKKQTGSELAGPTLVFKLLPKTETLFAASELLKQGREVCITGVANEIQGLACTSLPHVEEREPELRTEGPPASRNPYAPDSVACYVGRLDDEGRQGALTVVTLARLFKQYGLRTRVLAASIRSRLELLELTAAIAESPIALNVDVTLPESLFDTLLDDSITAKAIEQFAQAEEELS